MKFHNFRRKNRPIRYQITGANAEFPSEFAEIRFKIRIQAKIAEKKERKSRFQRRNLEKI